MYEDIASIDNPSKIQDGSYGDGEENTEVFFSPLTSDEHRAMRGAADNDHTGYSKSKAERAML